MSICSNVLSVCVCFVAAAARWWYNCCCSWCRSVFQSSTNKPWLCIMSAACCLIRWCISCLAPPPVYCISHWVVALASLMTCIAPVSNWTFCKVAIGSTFLNFFSFFLFFNKKSELMLMKCTRAIAQVILVYLHLFCWNSLFCSRKLQKITKNPYFSVQGRQCSYH